MISAAERKRRQRENILDTYRRNYAKPFWEAYHRKDSKAIDKYLGIGYAFRLGVFMAAPHSRYYEAFNRVDKELKKEIAGDD